MTDREKVTEWLKSIGALPDEQQEVLQMCVKCGDARRFYV